MVLEDHAPAPRPRTAAPGIGQSPNLPNNGQPRWLSGEPRALSVVVSLQPRSHTAHRVATSDPVTADRLGFKVDFTTLLLFGPTA